MKFYNPKNLFQPNIVTSQWKLLLAQIPELILSVSMPYRIKSDAKIASLDLQLTGSGGLRQTNGPRVYESQS